MKLFDWLVRRSWGTGVLFGSLGAIIVLGFTLLAIASIRFGGSYLAIEGFPRIQPGMALAEVEQVLGPADGTLSAATLTSYARERPPAPDFDAIERMGGAHRLWVSRSENWIQGETFVLNVVCFGPDERVVDTFTGSGTRGLGDGPAEAP